MQVRVLKRNGLKLSQGAAVLLLAGISAGCSSQVARFGGVDDFMTASTPNQREIIRPSAQTSGAETAGMQQPYPGDTAQVQAAPTNGTYAGSVTRGALAPVSTAPVAASASIGVNKKKFWLLTSVMCTGKRPAQRLASSSAVVTPAKPPPRIRMRIAAAA